MNPDHPADDFPSDVRLKDADGLGGGGVSDDTSLRVRGAFQGSREDLDWLVVRLSPLLRAQAAFRLGKHGTLAIDPDDCVAEVWLVALQRFGDLKPREGRLTPVLLAFLSSITVNIVRRRLRNLSRRRAAHGNGSADHSEDPDRRAANVTDVVTRAARAELAGKIGAAIGQLEEKDREVVILRGVENLDNDEAAAVLGERPNTVAQRYRRALAKLRSALPQSVFDEFADG